MQEALSHQKRNATSAPANTPAAKRPNRTTSAEEQSGQSSLHQLNLEILKLNQELSALRETNKFLEEKIQVSSVFGFCAMLYTMSVLMRLNDYSEKKSYKKPRI